MKTYPNPYPPFLWIRAKTAFKEYNSESLRIIKQEVGKKERIAINERIKPLRELLGWI